jgi:hypothetical protein
MSSFSRKPSSAEVIRGQSDSFFLWSDHKLQALPIVVTIEPKMINMHIANLILTIICALLVFTLELQTLSYTTQA